MFVLQLSNFNLFFSLKEKNQKPDVKMCQKAAFPSQPCAGMNDKCWFLPPESKPLAAISESAHFVTAAVKQGKFCADQNKIPKSLPVQVYVSDVVGNSLHHL